MPSAEIYRIYLLHPGSRPRRHAPLTWSNVGAHRHLECSWYTDCLHFVARSPWSGFSCENCPYFEKRPRRIQAS
ncbi:MAG TPA: hypothetical protein VM425_13640 [Myxococcota bacterium]|nr:hypothetical protein [Myxococcota bacterium]